ncbi:hypothetical protein GCM10020369_77870 [Cryptosporangium minutisporangium]|uniref:DUF6879 domain-containing protein n=1 Tax=Cryptosporangium minutisporangium TaxID=113569 RepID=A0ABP6TBH0_9ACTN
MGGSNARIAWRIVISLAIGGLTYGLTSLTNARGSGAPDQAALTALTLSVFLGGVVLVVQFLMELDGRLRAIEERQIDHEQNIHEVVHRAFTRITESSRLLGMLEESAARSDAVTQMVRHAILIKPGEPDLVYEFAQNEITRTSSFLKALAAGEATYEGEDRDWLIGLTDCTRSHIDATSFATVDAGGDSFGNGFWQSALGRRYLQAQQDARQRGVTVRRIFIFDKPDMVTDEGFRDICTMQRAAGIDLRVLDYHRINQSHMDLRDFIIFDGDVSYETVASSSRVNHAVPAILNTKLVLDIGQLRKRAADFEYLWSLGKSLEEYLVLSA